MIQLKKINKGTLLFFILLTVQFIYMLYWGMQKSGYYVDEFFTYDNAHYISASTPAREKLYDADYMEYDQWFPVLELKGTLTVQREEALYKDSLIYNAKALIKNRPYMAALNYVEAIFFEGELNWWSAISLNLFFFLLNQALLYGLVIKVGKNRQGALIAMALYGFCGMAVSMLVYVRFYMYATLMVTAFTYLHACMWEERLLYKNIAWEALATLALFVAFRMSPLCAIFGGALIVCFLGGLLFKKRWIQAACYGVPILGGGAFYAVFMTDYVKALVNPQKALEGNTLNTATEGLVRNFLSLTPYKFVHREINFLHIVCRFLFGHAGILVLFSAVFMALLFLFLFGRIRNKESIGLDGNGAQFGFTCILLGAVLAYAAASAAFNLSLIRYNSFIFPEIAACCILLISHFSNLKKYKKAEYAITIVLSAAILGEIFYTCAIPRIENLYREDREGIQAIREHGGINSVVVDYQWDDRVMYECLAYADEETKVMFKAYGDTGYEDLDDIVLLWQTVNRGLDVQDDLEEAGYTSMEEIAQTHESVVYLCKRR